MGIHTMAEARSGAFLYTEEDLRAAWDSGYASTSGDSSSAFWTWLARRFGRTRTIPELNTSIH